MEDDRYHLRRSEKEITSEEELLRILLRGRYTTMALCSEGEPYVVTMSYGYDSGADALYFHCAPEGLKIDFIKRNPGACATVIEDRGYRHGLCDHSYRSVVMRGNISIVEDIEEKVRAIDALLDHQESDPGPIRKRNIGSGMPRDVMILRLDIEDITGKEG